VSLLNDPRLEEAIIAALALTAFAAVLDLALWQFAGLAPWPGPVLGELIGFGWGVVLLTISSPRRRR
jgi:hypothetical protein